MFLINILAIQFQNIEELIEKHGLQETFLLVSADSHWVSQHKPFNGAHWYITLHLSGCHEYTCVSIQWVPVGNITQVHYQ